MPLWFVGVCAVMGAVLAYWLVQEVVREWQIARWESDWQVTNNLKKDHERERAVFEAIARGRR